MTRVEMGGQFKFSIKARRRNLGPNPPAYLPEIEWEVRLPHQCDEWSISGEVTSKAEAVGKLEAFIAEAQATLERLRALPENAHDA